MSLEKILSAKEERAKMRQAIANNNLASLSLSLNIPSYPKSTKEINNFFLLIKTEINDYLLAHRVIYNTQAEITLTDSAGDFCISSLSSNTKDIAFVKNLCENFEENHPLGRIIDIDIVDTSGHPVSSGKLKKCFLCNAPAIECMHKGTHTKQELRSFIDSEIKKYLYQEKLKSAKIQLAAYATQALLYEVSLSPKPGLVHRYGNGCHKDMNFFSFINSSSILSTYWINIIDLAYNTKSDNEQNIIALREIGIVMEREMLKFTHGVNTQKGAIFIIGTLVFAVAKLISDNKDIKDKNIKDIIISLHKNIFNDELLSLTSEEASHGIKNYHKYGAKNCGGGIREEASLAFPTLFNEALPVMRDLLNNHPFSLDEDSIQNILTKTLIKIISKNSDSNIIYRSNIETLKQLQCMAEKCFNEKNNFETSYSDLQKFCFKKNVSPGGSADLLAATIFVYQSQQNFL